MGKEKLKKCVAPAIITVILILYFILYFGFLFAILPGVWRYILLVFPIVFSGLIIYVFIDRIKEIRSGEEDDISKY
jgi:hypothetical protein